MRTLHKKDSCSREIKHSWDEPLAFEEGSEAIGCQQREEGEAGGAAGEEEDVGESRLQ